MHTIRMKLANYRDTGILSKAFAKSIITVLIYLLVVHGPESENLPPPREFS